MMAEVVMIDLVSGVMEEEEDIFKISTNTRDSPTGVNSLSEITLLCQESKVTPAECRLHVRLLRSVWNRVNAHATLAGSVIHFSREVRSREESCNFAEIIIKE
ncbi:Myb/SANT-like DNA-binding domain-containing protein 2 [Manis javanica]|nr:Myb/SANT-like DNA-binding domain-containing protein 2 [Manis javanica]